MTKKEHIDRECECFTASREDNIVIIHFREHMLFHATNFRTRDNVLEYLNDVSKDDSIKVIVIFSSSEKRDLQDYINFYNQLLKSKLDINLFFRLCNIIDQFILKIVGLGKFIIHVNRGDVISLFSNISLACDYRIIADDTIFHNPYIDLGLLPKGGGPFFLSKILDSGKIYEVLMLRREITSHEALKLGLVDRVVPASKLEETALEFAQSFRKIPLSTLSGIKKLKNYSIHDLKDYLELENEELIKIVEPAYWRTTPKEVSM